VRSFGQGEGHGYNLNVPLLAGKGDADYLYIFERILAPIAAQFAPEFILVSAGFDIGAGDPLGGMSVTPAGFGRMTAALLAMAERTAGGRLALVLEGGYDLTVLKNGVSEVLKALSRGTVPAEASGGGSLLPSEALRVELREARATFRAKWDLPEA
ncbi:MAG: histone deacetylase, partial [Candidatus Aminicenantes bacterium]|nr:histone deacetylase [Candidatus Aminicenantes bacterium]